MLAFWFRAASIDNRDCACRGRFAAGGAEEKEKLAIGVPVTFTVGGGGCPLAVGCQLSAVDAVGWSAVEGTREPRTGRWDGSLSSLSYFCLFCRL